jgi:hypothetical protein
MAKLSAAPVSRPGRLLVEHDRGLGLGPSLWPLGEVRPGEHVTVTAEITGFKAFPGRVHLILDDGHGGSAAVTIDSAKVMAAFRAAGSPPRVGVRVEVRGEVVQPPVPSAPRGIEARFIRVVA